MKSCEIVASLVSVSSCSSMVGLTELHRPSRSIILSICFCLLLNSFQVSNVESAPANHGVRSYLPPPLCRPISKEVERRVEEEECRTVDEQRYVKFRVLRSVKQLQKTNVKQLRRRFANLLMKRTVKM
jgi:hypothetical protein